MSSNAVSMIFPLPAHREIRRMVGTYVMVVNENHYLHLSMMIYEI